MRRRLSILLTLIPALAAVAPPALGQSPADEASPSGGDKALSAQSPAAPSPAEQPPVYSPPVIPPITVVSGAPALLAGPAMPASLRLTGTPMLTISGPNFPSRGSKNRGDETPLQVVGTVIAGLGAATLFASGVTWIVAATNASRLDQHCPNGVCVEGTPGGDAYVTTRDALKGADIVAGVGFPVLGAGIVMLVFSATFRKGASYATRTLPVVKAGPSGANLAVHF
jgi:hypothetical protein